MAKKSTKAKRKTTRKSRPIGRLDAPSKPDDDKRPEYRSFDGSGNNEKNPQYGRAGEPLLRTPTRAHYADGESEPRTGPNARAISNAVCRAEIQFDPHPELSSYMWAWGQFLDHEIDLTPESEEHADIQAPGDDPVAPRATISFPRSIVAEGTGENGVPREQVNVLSAYVDATNVYGSSLDRAMKLRALDGTGRLKVSPGKHGDLLPYNTVGLGNAQGPLRRADPLSSFFVAGDVRANEHNVLTCMHTLFVREHNRECEQLASNRSSQLAREIAAIGRDEAIFQRARRHVVALEQVITYEEFLPALLGPRGLPKYRGYDPDVDASIANVFSTAAYRLGHDMLNSSIALVSPFGAFLKNLRLDRAFWKPEQVQRLGIDVFLAGLARTNMEQINAQTIEDIRSNLFNVHPEQPGMLLDLASLNILRGRDHGVPTYNQCRVDYGLKKVRRFEDITRDADRVARLKAAYDSVDEIDLWIGGLCEDPHQKAIVGELFFAILRDQFVRLRDGDRFWYEAPAAGFGKADIRRLKRTRLSDVIRRNTLIGRIQKDVFRTT